MSAGGVIIVVLLILIGSFMLGVRTGDYIKKLRANPYNHSDVGILVGCMIMGLSTSVTVILVACFQ